MQVVPSSILGQALFPILFYSIHFLYNPDAPERTLDE